MCERSERAGEDEERQESVSEHGEFLGLSVVMNRMPCSPCRCKSLSQNYRRLAHFAAGAIAAMAAQQDVPGAFRRGWSPSRRTVLG